MRDIRGARGVTVAFERRNVKPARVVARVCATIDADQIAAAMEAALALPPPTAETDDVEIRLIRDGLSFPIQSARLARVGAALIERAGSIF